MSKTVFSFFLYYYLQIKKKINIMNYNTFMDKQGNICLRKHIYGELGSIVARDVEFAFNIMKDEMERQWDVAHEQNPIRKLRLMKIQDVIDYGLNGPEYGRAMYPHVCKGFAENLIANVLTNKWKSRKLLTQKRKIGTIRKLKHSQ